MYFHRFEGGKGWVIEKFYTVEWVDVILAGWRKAGAMVILKPREAKPWSDQSNRCWWTAYETSVGLCCNAADSGQTRSSLLPGGGGLNPQKSAFATGLGLKRNGGYLKQYSCWPSS